MAQTARYGARHEEPGLLTALGHVLQAGQRVVIDRIELIRLEVLEVVRRGVDGVALIVAGVMPLLVGWLALAGALFFVLDDFLAPEANLALTGLVQLVAGAALVAAGVQRARRAREALTGERKTEAAAAAHKTA